MPGSSRASSPPSLPPLQPPHPHRWGVLALWWTTHGLVGGSARVIFEAHLPDIARLPAFALAEADIARMLQLGTLVTLAAKLCAGPASSALGPYHIGWLSLLGCGSVVLGVGLTAGGDPVLSVLLAWLLMRAFQSFTWPATNLLVDAWFPEHEHGRAWGVMSTASRSGIMGVTGAMALMARPQMGGGGGDGGDGSSSGGDAAAAAAAADVRGRFLVVGAVLVAAGAVLSLTLRSRPATASALPDAVVQPKKKKGAEENEEEPEGSPSSSLCHEVLRSTVAQPTFFLACLIQATVCPIAEFQSQVPLWLSRDASLSVATRGLGVAAWHLGILAAVLTGGWLFDRASELGRGVVLALPLLCNAGLFVVLRGMEAEGGGDGGGDTAVESGTAAAAAAAGLWAAAARVGVPPKLLLSFLLGATFAPANYLNMSIWTMRHASRRAMPVASSLIDLCGYAGTIAVLQLQVSSDGDKLSGILRVLTLSGTACAALVAALFACEHVSFSKAKRKDKVQ